MKAFFSLIITLLLLKSNVKGQACGGGKYHFTFYSINGTEVKNVRYDFYEINVDSLNARLANPGRPGKIALTYFGHHLEINVLDDIVIDEHKKGKERYHPYNKMSGVIKNGKLEANTLELNSMPILLKLTTNKKELYFVGNFFGGCNTWQNILLN